MNKFFLGDEEVRKCQEVFDRFDTEGTGSIETWELRECLQELGEEPSEEELFSMISELDQDPGGKIGFKEFVRLVELQKATRMEYKPDMDTLEAFVALGGNPDKTGQLDTQKLKTLVLDLGLTVDIDKLIMEADTDGSGFVDFDEFAEIMKEDGE